VVSVSSAYSAGQISQSINGGGNTIYSASISGSYTINPALGNIQVLTLTGNVTLYLATFNTGKACEMAIYLYQDSIGTHSVAWSSAASFPAGASPTINTAASARTRVYITSLNGGSSYDVDEYADDIAPPLVGPVLKTGMYYANGYARAGTTSNSQGVGTLKVAPIRISRACTISEFDIYVSTVGDSTSTFLICLYSDDGTGVPGLLLNSSSVATTVTGTVAATVSLTLAAGNYWLGGSITVAATQPTLIVNDVANIALPASTAAGVLGGAMGISTSGVTSTAPSPFPSSFTDTGSCPRVAYKITA
jgi:hypothetical protein